LLLCIALMAFLYASVGHGGASGYHAVMALFLVTPLVMKSTALTLNIFVAGVSFYHYYKAGYFKWKLFLPFAIGSIPFAFVGGYIQIQEEIYKGVLGLFLIFAVLKMLGFMRKKKNALVKLPSYLGVIFGALLGFVSGLLGIGGGIILSPVLLLFNWAKMKQAAAVSALFIFVNSISGLIGLVNSGSYNAVDNLLYWIVIALVGGCLGSYLGARKMKNSGVRKLLALVLFLASIKLLSGFVIYIFN